jgi:hypothetical protein
MLKNKNFMEKNLDKLNKKDNANTTQSGRDEHMQEEKKITSDKISINRNIGGLSDRDDAPGSGININKPEEHTLGNP